MYPCPKRSQRSAVDGDDGLIATVVPITGELPEQFARFECPGSSFIDFRTMVPSLVTTRRG